MTPGQAVYEKYWDSLDESPPVKWDANIPHTWERWEAIAKAAIEVHHTEPGVACEHYDG